MRVVISSRPPCSSRACTALRARLRKTCVRRSASATSSGIDGSKTRSKATWAVAGSAATTSSTSSISRCRFTGARRSVSLRANTMSSSTRPVIRSTSRTITWAVRRVRSSSARSSISSAAPRMPPSGFFTSWAMPAAMWPYEASSSSCVASLRSVLPMVRSCSTTTTPPGPPVCSSETGETARSSSTSGPKRRASRTSSSTTGCRVFWTCRASSIMG